MTSKKSIVNRNRKKIVFYFPWEEYSGGPIYLASLANEMARDNKYEIYYTDYQNGLSNKMLSPTVKKLTVSREDFSIKMDNDIITIITPIYWANQLPKLHPKSKILFVNWHNCCIPVLKKEYSNKYIDNFLKIVGETNSVFFCDYAHWQAQNTKNIVFKQNYVPIIAPIKKQRLVKKNIVSEKEINIGVLGRICLDKIFSIINLLDNLSKLETNLSKNLYIIGDGKYKNKIDISKYPDINIIFCGKVINKDLDKILLDKIDILFAMGTSILESAALGIPSVIMPHNIKSISCDSYAYLHNSKDYLLGWYDTQINDIDVKFQTLESIINDIYYDRLKEKIGNLDFIYCTKNHHVNNSAINLKKFIASTYLQYTELNHFNINLYKRIFVFKFLLITLLEIYRKQKLYRSTKIKVRILKLFNIFSIKHDLLSKTKIFYLFGFIPIVKIKRF